jgi:hypothetical protein
MVKEDKTMTGLDVFDTTVGFAPKAGVFHRLRCRK